MIKKATVFFMAVMMVMAMATGAWALAYYESGSGDTNMKFKRSATDVRTLWFNDNTVTGPEGALVGLLQSISGTYTLAYQSGDTLTGIYTLTSASANSMALDAGNATPELAATMSATATMNFTTDTIVWDVFTVGTIANNIGSETLTQMQTIKDNMGTFKFTTAFEQNTSIDTWLSGSGSMLTKDTIYTTKLEGITAAPEPAEWVLMFIGLGMLGFYLQRRGYLNFDLSPQSVA